MEDDDDPCVSQWLSEVQSTSSSFLHSPVDSSPCQHRKRKAVSPPPSDHSSSSIGPSPKHLRLGLPSYPAIHHQQTPLVDSAIFLTDSNNERHIEGLSDIEMASKVRFSTKRSRILRIFNPHIATTLNS